MNGAGAPRKPGAAIILALLWSSGCAHPRSSPPSASPPASAPAVKVPACVAEPNDAAFAGPAVSLDDVEGNLREWALRVSGQLQAGTKALVSCYERRLAEDPSVKGVALLSFAVAPEGIVRRAAVEFALPGEERLARRS